MGVDDINRPCLVQLLYSPQYASVEQHPCTGESECARRLRVTYPLCRSRSNRVLSRVINRRYRYHCGVHAEFLKLLDRLRNKAAADLISIRREKWSESQDVQARIPLIRWPHQLRSLSDC